jgi:alpha-ketoglutarate-dependent taurine dioxygenase
MSESMRAPKRSLKDLGAGRRRAVVASAREMVEVGPLEPGEDLPLQVRPAGPGVDLVAWVADRKDWVEEELLRHGGVLFRGFGLKGPESLEAVAAALAGETLEYKERSSPRSQVAGKVYTSTDFPADQPIFFHNENSYQAVWPAKIFFFCHQPAEQGGETPIVDVRRVLERIPQEVRARFEELGVLYVRNFRPGMGLPWQTVFQTADRSEVDAYCRATGLETEWLDDSWLRIRVFRPAFVRHPKSGETLWFNHGTFFHVSTLEAPLREALLGQYAEDELPSQTFYGDGAPIEPEVLDALRQAYREPSVSFPWRKGDLLVLDNMLVAHARSPYRGDRKILVAMAAPVDRAAVTI